MKGTHILHKKLNYKGVGQPRVMKPKWVILTDQGIIMANSNGEWKLEQWIDKANSQVAIMYEHRWEAQKLAKKIRRQRKDLISWTQTIPIKTFQIG